MNIRSVLLGTLALAGLTSGGYAADLGVVTSLDVCDELGLTGLTISSDTNCLVISGYVGFEYDYGSYEDKASVVGFNNAKDTTKLIYDDGGLDSDVDIDAWLKLVATSDSDFGPATATIELELASSVGTSDQSVGVEEAWVGIGDTTVIMAGYKSSIFNKGDDTPLSYLGLFHSDNVDSSPGLSSSTRDTGVQANLESNSDSLKTGNAVLQVTSNLGNGLTASAGIENLGLVSGEVTAVGVLAYKGEGLTAHVSVAANPTDSTWRTHAGFTGTWDPITLVGAIAANSDGYWNGLASAAVNLDIFKLAASVEAAHSDNTNDAAHPDEFGAGGSLTAKVTDEVTLNLGGRYFTNYDERVYQAEAGISAKVADTITLTGAIGLFDSTFSGTYYPSASSTYAGLPVSHVALGTAYYGKVGAAWAPGGGFTASASLQVTSQSAWQVVTKAAKTIN